jgi:hypothetical protein
VKNPQSANKNLAIGEAASNTAFSIGFSFGAPDS